MPREGYYLPQSRRLVSQDDASIIARPNVPRSRFTGSWSRKTSFNAGYLVPFMVDEVLPGDHLSYDVTAYVRMATPLFPMFDNQRVDTHFFFVPMRLLWINWERFMGAQDNPSSSIAFTIPTLNAFAGAAVGDIYDHYTLPLNTDITGSISVNALPFRAYNLIYNTWFRDQNIQNSLVNNYDDDGPDATTDYALQLRAKSHDYFTSALPWPQKFTAPNVGLTGNALIRGIGMAAGVPAGAGGNFFESSGSLIAYAAANPFSAANTLYSRTVDIGAGNSRPDIYADLSTATGFSVNVFRQAIMIQQLLERDATGGTRYTELIRAHFGVINPDFRLQRPEYIGGGNTPLMLTPIAQTAPTAGVPLGALGAAGTAAGQHRASYAATEHGYIIALISIKSELSYQRSLHKMFSRSTRYDFYWPSLAQLGEQAILRQEIFCNGVDADDATVFGYQERWHEYRTRYSEVTSVMRSNAAGTLDAWHLAQDFAAAPTLNGSFIIDEPPMARVLAAGISSNQQYLADILINRTAVRPIPMFGTPATLGRF